MQGFLKGEHYQFDYIEPDSSEKLRNSNDLSIIGCIKLKEIEKEDALIQSLSPAA